MRYAAEYEGGRIVLDLPTDPAELQSALPWLRALLQDILDLETRHPGMSVDERRQRILKLQRLYAAPNP